MDTIPNANIGVKQSYIIKWSSQQYETQERLTIDAGLPLLPIKLNMIIAMRLGEFPRYWFFVRCSFDETVRYYLDTTCCEYDKYIEL